MLVFSGFMPVFCRRLSALNVEMQLATAFQHTNSAFHRFDSAVIAHAR